jgi:hypothetical protein
MTTLICLDISSKLFFVSDDSKTVHWLDLLVDGIGVPAGSERIHITIMLIMKRELIMVRQGKRINSSRCKSDLRKD